MKSPNQFSGFFFKQSHVSHMMMLCEVKMNCSTFDTRREMLFDPDFVLFHGLLQVCMLAVRYVMEIPYGPEVVAYIFVYLEACIRVAFAYSCYE